MYAPVAQWTEHHPPSVLGREFESRRGLRENDGLFRHHGYMTPALDSFTSLSYEEMLILGLLWKHYTEFDPSPAMGVARESILACVTPEDGADLRAAHAARAEAEDVIIPIESYTAVQWSYLAERYRENISAASRKAMHRSWSAAFPKKPHDPEVVAAVLAQTAVDDDGFFDFGEPVAGHVPGQPDPEPDWDQEREHTRFRQAISPLLPA